MDKLFAQQDRLLSQTPMKIIRKCGMDINWNARMMAIRGPKGIGKSTLIKQYIRQHYKAGDKTVLYCSMDNNYFADHSILNLAEEFYLKGGKHLFIDEIHKYAHWSRELKEIYDVYPDMQVVISGSSLLSLQQGEADLSRRCINHDFQGLSFREYLQFYKGIDLPTCTLQKMLEDPYPFLERVYAQCKPMAFFDDYLSYGYYPYYMENEIDYYSVIHSVMGYVIDDELPRICGVDLENTRKIRALMNILAAGEPYEVDISRMSVQSGLQRKTILTYLKYLSDAKLVNLLYSDYINVKKMQKPDKIYIENTNMLKALATHPIKEGTLRETFAINHLAFTHSVEYGKQKGDFVVDGKFIIEVGGQGKTTKQIANVPNAYILADDIEFPIGNKLPLWILGFLY